MLGNPADKQAPKKAYGVAQYTEKMNLEQFSQHISDHNSVYDAEDVQAILGKAVKCLREMLLAGKKVELGKLGEFYITLRGKGAETAAKFNPEIHVEKVNVVWTPGKQFEDLKKDTTFNLVACRDEQQASIKKAKEAGTDPSTPGSNPSGGGSASPGGSSSGGSGSQGSGSTGSGSSGSDGDNTVE